MSSSNETAKPVAPKRPMGIKIMSVFSCACGILLGFLGATFLGLGGLSAVAGFPTNGIAPLVFGGVFIGLGVASFVSGLGLYNVSRWAWWLSFAAFLVTLIVSAAYLQIPAMVVNGAGVVLLLLVRKHFGIGQAKLTTG